MGDTVYHERGHHRVQFGEFLVVVTFPGPFRSSMLALVIFECVGEDDIQ